MTEIPPKPHIKSCVEQQKLRHLFPEHTSFPVAITLAIITIFLLPLGVVIIVSSHKVTELEYRYDDVNKYTFTQGDAGVNAEDFAFNGSTLSMGTRTRVEVHLSKSISAPVFIQYRLRNFYQNYRWFGASIDLSQISGGKAALADTCEPYRWPGEVRGDRADGYYSPCGAVPWALFNDSINLYKESGELVCDGGAFDADGNSINAANRCKKKGIALLSDVDKSFLPAVPSSKESGPMWKSGGDASSSDPFLSAGYYYQESGHKIPLSTDEDFIVWANAAYTGDFRVPYRIIETDLPAGDYYFDIVELFDIVSLKGKKFVQLTTRSWIGGRNHHLGILMVVVGGVAFVIAVTIIILRVTAFRRPSYI